MSPHQLTHFLNIDGLLLKFNHPAPQENKIFVSLDSLITSTTIDVDKMGLQYRYLFREVFVRLALLSTSGFRSYECRLGILLFCYITYKLLSPNHIICQANTLNQLPPFMVQTLPINTKARRDTIRSLGSTFLVKISNGSLHS